MDFPKENYPKFSWPSNPITYANNSEIFTKEFQVYFTKNFCDNNFVKKYGDISVFLKKLSQKNAIKKVRGVNY